MVTSLGDISNGKENVPDPVTTVPTKPSKATPQKDKARHEKSKSMKGLQDFSAEPVVTNQAFDKLLVSDIPSQKCADSNKDSRMSSRSHSVYVQSLLTWMLR